MIARILSLLAMRPFIQSVRQTAFLFHFFNVPFLFTMFQKWVRCTKKKKKNSYAAVLKDSSIGFNSFLFHPYPFPFPTPVSVPSCHLVSCLVLKRYLSRPVPSRHPSPVPSSFPSPSPVPSSEPSVVGRRPVQRGFSWLSVLEDCRQ